MFPDDAERKPIEKKLPGKTAEKESQVDFLCLLKLKKAFVSSGKIVF